MEEETHRRPANSDLPNSPVAFNNFEIDSIPYVLNRANSSDSKHHIERLATALRRSELTQ